ncbi:hypothetical protein [Streptomyces chartreusis]
MTRQGVLTSRTEAVPTSAAADRPPAADDTEGARPRILGHSPTAAQTATEVADTTEGRTWMPGRSPAAAPRAEARLP